MSILPRKLSRQITDGQQSMRLAKTFVHAADAADFGGDEIGFSL